MKSHWGYIVLLWHCKTDRGGETPESIPTRLGVNNYVGNITNHHICQYGSDRSKWVVWSGRMREISLFVTFTLFFFDNFEK